MDLNMPGLDGVQATQQIRQFAIGQFIIVAHTAIPKEQFGDYNEKGFDDFLQKPIDNKVLAKIIKKLGLNN